jgi:hypothetical protein
MKNTTLYVTLIALFISFNCFSISKLSVKPKEIDIPCAKEGRSDANFFRTSGSAKSRDMASAKDKALMVTKQMLSSLISSTIKATTDNYSTSIEAANATSFKQAFESMTREIVNQQIKKIAIVCEKTNKAKDGMYECFLAVEMPKTALIDEFNKAVESDQKLKVDYDKQKFEAILEQEMNKLGE